MAEAYEYHPLTYNPTTATLTTTNPSLTPYINSINLLTTQLPPMTDTLKSTPLPPHAQIDRSLLPLIQGSQYLSSQRSIAESASKSRLAAEAALNNNKNNDVSSFERSIALCDESIATSHTRPPWERIFMIDETAAAYTIRCVANLRLRRFPTALSDARIVIALKASIPDNMPSSQQKRVALAYFAGAQALKEMRRAGEARQWVAEGLGVDGPQLEGLNRQIRQLMENKWVVSQQGNQQQVMAEAGRKEIQGRYANWKKEVEQLRSLEKELEQ
ncbi:MAG: hypothetical protein M1828_006389 [Chrysothrix sp. TS-e1954]|nr:MAG: hypothetical protein M1828_006389 [Chrysothrix sp. TS-e1954]